MKIKKMLEKIWKEIIYGGHLQCLGVVGIVFASTIVLNLDINIIIIALVYLISYPIYVNDRLKGIETDKLTNPERTEHYKSYLYFMPKIIILSIFFLIILLLIINNLTLYIFSLLTITFGFFYPIFFKNITKRIIGFKNFFVASFFTSIILIPILFYESFELILTLPFILLTILVFIKTVLMQILLDTKDIEGDKLAGLLTIPVLIGRENSLNFLKNFTFLTTILIIISFLFIPDFPKIMLLLVFVAPVNFLSYYLASKKKYIGYIIGSAEFTTWLSLALFKDILW